MGSPVRAGAVMTCSFGMAPSVLDVEPISGVIVSTPAATIADMVPTTLDVAPSAMCSRAVRDVHERGEPGGHRRDGRRPRRAHPAAMVPVRIAPSAPGSPTVLYGGIPALTDDAICECMWGGVATIDEPGHFEVEVEQAGSATAVRCSQVATPQAPRTRRARR